MSSERESSLAVMNIHYDQDIDVDAVIEIIAQTGTPATLVAGEMSAES